MKRSILAVAAAAAALAIPATAQADGPDGTLSIDPGDTASAIHIGQTASGHNISYFFDGLATTGSCGKTLEDMCETILVHVTGEPQTDEEKAVGKYIKFRMDGFTAASDFDLRVYDSNASGAKLSHLGSPRGDSTYDETTGLGTLDPRNTGPGDYERKVVKPTKDDGQYYLVEIPYFAVVNDHYHLTVSWTKEFPF